VKRLTSHTDKSVSQLARRVLSSWKNHFEEKLAKPSLDVRCDHETTASRETVRKHIANALMIDCQQESLVCCVIFVTSHNFGKISPLPLSTLALIIVPCSPRSCIE